MNRSTEAYATRAHHIGEHVQLNVAAIRLAAEERHVRVVGKIDHGRCATKWDATKGGQRLRAEHCIREISLSPFGCDASGCSTYVEGLEMTCLQQFNQGASAAIA